MKKFLFILFLFEFAYCVAQKDTLPYNRKEEIVYDGKRYRKYNNYLTFGVGKASSNLRSEDQNVLNVDYQFHLTKQYFQIGFFMSGNELLSNNNMQAHIGYGIRRERNLFNLAAFAGPSFSYFVTAATDTAGVTRGVVNNALGGYVCLQGIYKFKYDVGLGIELFADLTAAQRIYGVRAVFYFSGAYKGIKRGFNPPKKRS